VLVRLDDRLRAHHLRPGPRHGLPRPSVRPSTLHSPNWRSRRSTPRTAAPRCECSKTSARPPRHPTPSKSAINDRLINPGGGASGAQRATCCARRSTHRTRNNSTPLSTTSGRLEHRSPCSPPPVPATPAVGPTGLLACRALTCGRRKDPLFIRGESRPSSLERRLRAVSRQVAEVADRLRQPR
jgi:hypothetical protein